MKKISINLLLLLFSGLFSVLVLEFVVRKTTPWYDPAKQVKFATNYDVYADGVPLAIPSSTQVVATPKGDFKLKVKINKYGLRDEKDLLDASNEAIFLLGDSYSFGWGLKIEDRYSNLLEKILDDPIYNISIPGDMEDYLKLLGYTNTLLQTKNKEVKNLILAICMENDLKKYGDTFDSSYKNEFSFVNAMKDLLKENSALYLLMSFELQKIPFVRTAFEKIGYSTTIDKMIPKNEFRQDVIDGSIEKVLEIKDRVENLLVVILPSRALWQGDNTVGELKLHNVFVDSLKKQKIKVVDLKKNFENTSDPLNYFFKTDPHWNKLGSQLVARSISQDVMNYFFVDKTSLSAIDKNENN